MAVVPGQPGGAVSSEGRRSHQPGFHRVIVIDDEVGIRRGCQRVLSADGHEVLAADTAEAGLEVLAARSDVDLALIDIRLPGMDGLEFISRAAEIAPQTVCVVITAYATLDTAIEATKRGAYDFLTKPFTPEELFRVVNKALERAHLMREREGRLLELATEQSRLRGVVNSMLDAVMVCNAEGELVLHNPAALRFLPRLSPGETISRLGEVLEPAELGAMITESSAGHRWLSRELQLPQSQGGGWVLAGVAPLADQGPGKSQGTVTVLRDITALKQVEEVKAQFVNMVAHELRAPLGAVIGYLSVLRQGLVDDSAKQTEMLSRSEQRIQALLDLVSDLLDVSRMEAGRVRREIGPQQLPALVAEVVELMTPQAAQRQIALHTELPEGLPTVGADREELIRLLNNLVSNAIKYNREGGSVTVSAVADGPYVKLSVSDTGVGISPEGLKRLFTEFFREKQPETAMVTGTGLGLSIVKRIVDFYHGRVEAESKLGEGTTFHVWLPCECEADVVTGQVSG